MISIIIIYISLLQRITDKYFLINRFFQPACTSNRLIEPHRPDHVRVLCVNVAIAAQKNTSASIVKKHFEIMSHIHQNTSSNTKMRLEISVSRSYVSMMRLPNYDWNPSLYVLRQQYNIYFV